MSRPPADPPYPDGSQLDRLIARFTTQRACLDAAAAMIAELPGPVLELGLGKGRTYDHLRRRLPDRQIYVFDKEIHAPPDYVPEKRYLILGDFAVSLADARRRLGAPAALAHADIGSDDRRADVALAATVAGGLAPLMAKGGLVLSDRAMEQPGWTRLPLPPGAGGWPYFFYRVGHL